MKEIAIQIDTREQKPWIFEEEPIKKGKTVRIIGSIEESLSAGDYCIYGAEDLCVIERKLGFSEIYGNIINKEGRERFEKELEKLKKVKFKYLVIESGVNLDLLSLSVPQYKFGPPVSKVIDELYNYQIDYNITPIFANNCGQKIVRNIFKNMAKRFL